MKDVNIIKLFQKKDTGSYRQVNLEVYYIKPDKI